jgi:WD40 repeat protein
MVSGGGDGAVRIWRLSNRELLNQYSEHAKGISKVLVDNKHTNIVHSASLDCTVLSYNLKISKRQICHIIKGGHITDMTQRWDSENELVTCDTNGRLLHWDIDVREPVLAIKDAGHLPNLRTCAISPTGNYLAFAGDDSMLKILHVPSSQIVSLGRGHSGVITCLSWTPDEKQIVTGGQDSCMCVWNFYLGGMS